jgi:hypothetical protein
MEFPERPPAIQNSVTHVSETQVEPAPDIPKSESSVLSKEKKPSKIKQMALLMQQILQAEDNDEDEEASTAEYMSNDLLIFFLYNFSPPYQCNKVASYYFFSCNESLLSLSIYIYIYI